MSRREEQQRLVLRPVAAAATGKDVLAKDLDWMVDKVRNSHNASYAQVQTAVPLHSIRFLLVTN